ncbi:MAG: ankyrin repeat domain-containing protein, partial [Armatimonadetes bacterium]|nr:ankyrin repeat domain-containing protein [Armatimonadota bacterium]
RLLWVFTHDAYHAGQIQYLRALQEIPADRLFTAAWRGDVARMRDVLEGNPNLLNGHSREGWTALQLASHFGHANAVRFLLDRGADVGIKSTNEMANTALHGAIAGKRTKIVPLLLDQAADPEVKDSGGNTALHLAAHEGVPEIVEVLLRRGANINARRNDGLTPLGVAAKEANTAVQDVLRKRGGIE